MGVKSRLEDRSIVFLVDILKDPSSKLGTTSIYEESICSGYKECNSLLNIVSTCCLTRPRGNEGYTWQLYHVAYQFRSFLCNPL